MLSTRDLLFRLPAVALLTVAAACGGDDAETAAPADETSAPVVTETPAPTEGTAAATGNVVEIQMSTTQNGASGQFEPQTVTVKRGDTVRWVMADGQTVHNVSFSAAQGNPAGWTAPAESSYLSQAGQTYEVVVDWPAGTYNYVCVPHQALGMTGSLTVTE